MTLPPTPRICWGGLRARSLLRGFIAGRSLENHLIQPLNVLNTKTETNTPNAQKGARVLSTKAGIS